MGLHFPILFKIREYYGVPTYPKLKLFRYGTNIMEYTGSRTSSEFVEFMLRASK